MKTILSDCVVTRVLNETAAAQTPVNTTIVDMEGLESVAFFVSLGTVTDGSVLTVTLMENTVNSTSGAVAATNGATTAVTASGNSNAVIVAEAIRPSKRYVYASITRTAQNAEINSVMAIQYGPRITPTTQPASVVAQAQSSPEY